MGPGDGGPGVLSHARGEGGIGLRMKVVIQKAVTIVEVYSAEVGDLRKFMDERFPCEQRWDEDAALQHLQDQLRKLNRKSGSPDHDAIEVLNVLEEELTPAETSGPTAVEYWVVEVP